MLQRYACVMLQELLSSCSCLRLLRCAQRMAQPSIITVTISVVCVRSRARSLSSVTSRCTTLTAVAKDSVGGSAEGSWHCVTAASTNRERAVVDE